MSASQDEIPPPPPPPPSSSQTPTQQTPQTVSTIKLPILKKGEYDIWAMKMEHYLAHTDYPIWEVIQNGNGPVSITTDTSGQIKVLPPRTAEEIVARERERKARTTLLMALPEDHLAKFHKMTDAKEMWDAIKSRFGGNDESKKMQKYILKQQFEGFSISNTEGLHKGYDRFQSLLSQLEIHGAGVSTEDANQKFLRSLPSAPPGEGGGWSQVSLIMRTKPGVDSLSFDDLYNNLRVFESDIKGSTASSSSPQNVAFVSENSSSTNEVSTAYCVPNLSGQNSKYEQTSSYSLLANQSSCPQLDHEDLEQIDEYDLEEMDFEVASSHDLNEMKKGTQDNRRRDAWNSGNKDGSRTVQKEIPKAIGDNWMEKSDKYCAENLKKFDFANVKTASIPIETSESPLVKDKEASDVDVHLYRSLQSPLPISKWLVREFLVFVPKGKPNKTGNPQQSTMAVLDSCPKHNMVAYLEKSEGNAEFHEIIDFLKRSSNFQPCTLLAKVVGKSVSISEASIRSDLLFDDADGIDSLPNQAIFDAIQLMGKVFSFMVKKGKHFSGKVTPLFATMLVQPTQEMRVLLQRRPSEAQPIPLTPAPTIK
ncbi:hypothetical protein Tco_1050606 [Tanacetum coccineum]